MHVIHSRDGVGGPPNSNLIVNSISKHNVFVRCYYCCSALVSEVYYALLIAEREDLTKF